MIHNIFEEKEKSKKPKKHKIVLIDHREKNSFVPSFLTKHGINFQFVHLKVGDYIVNNTIIERKTNLDFISSIIDKRIETQIEKLKEEKDKLLLIENSVKRPTNFNPNAIKGKILSLALKHKIPIIFTKNEEDSAIYMKILLNKKLD